jgi:hypothetical protein
LISFTFHSTGRACDAPLNSGVLNHKRNLLRMHTKKLAEFQRQAIENFKGAVDECWI